MEVRTDQSDLDSNTSTMAVGWHWLATARSAGTLATPHQYSDGLVTTRCRCAGNGDAQIGLSHDKKSLDRPSRHLLDNACTTP